MLLARLTREIQATVSSHNLARLKIESLPAKTVEILSLLGENHDLFFFKNRHLDLTENVQRRNKYIKEKEADTNDKSLEHQHCIRINMRNVQRKKNIDAIITT